MGNSITVPLEELPDDLTSASFTNRSLKRVPSRLSLLDKLSNLNLSRNEISRLPESLFENKSALKTLFLNTNLLSTLPSSVGSLTNLTVLSVQRNHLREIPAAMLKLEFLHELELQDNQIAGSVSLKGLSRLQHLNLNR